MTVEQFVDDTFETADLAAGGAVSFDERLEPLEALCARWSRAGGDLDLFEATQPGFDFSVGGELVADLGGEFGDLVCDMIQTQRTGCYQRSAVL